MRFRVHRSCRCTSSARLGWALQLTDHPAGRRDQAWRDWPSHGAEQQCGHGQGCGRSNDERGRASYGGEGDGRCDVTA